MGLKKIFIFFGLWGVDFRLRMAVQRPYQLKLTIPRRLEGFIASVKKFKIRETYIMLRHGAREIIESANPDIDQERTKENYTLTPDHGGLTDAEYFKERLGEVHHMKRKDLVTSFGWIVTAPKELPKKQEKAFFKSVENFIETRYGRENIIQSVVHRDEAGQPHIHVMAMPVADSARWGSKICANDVLTRNDLRSFHGDLQQHLNADGIKAKVQTGITKENGGNYTVKQLKRGEMTRERSRRRERSMDYEF